MMMLVKQGLLILVIVFPRYISPIDEENSRCTLIVIDHNIRQNDLQYLRILNNVTNGCVTNNDATCFSFKIPGLTVRRGTI